MALDLFTIGFTNLKIGMVELPALGLLLFHNVYVQWVIDRIHMTIWTFDEPLGNDTTIFNLSTRSAYGCVSPRWR